MNLTDRLRIHLPLVLLLGSIGAMLVAAFQAQDAVRRHEQQAEEALNDYATFASWSIRQHLKDELFGAAADVLQPVNHGNGLHQSSSIPPADEIAHLLPWDSVGCGCHPTRYPPIRFMAFTLGADTLAVVPNIYLHPDAGVVVDTVEALKLSEIGQLPDVPAYSDDVRHWIVDRLSWSVRNEFNLESQYQFIIDERNDRPYILAYRPMPRTAGDTIVYAVEFAPSTIGRLFGTIINQQSLLPPALTRDRTNREILAVEFRDAQDRVVYRSEPAPAQSAYASEDRIPDAYGGFGILARVKPEVADMLIIGGLPESRLPMLLGLLALAVTLAFVAFQQLRRAAALTRMRGDFVAAVSHELRTPLSQIRLYLDTLKHNRLSSDRDRAWSLDNLDREATRLGNLVENVLRFASIGQGRKARAEICDAAEEVRFAVAAFYPLARSRRVTIRSQLEPGITVPLSRDAFRVALHNLLDNAVKYGPPDQTIEVGLEYRAGRVRITVEDQGAGIPRELGESIWQPFQRGSDEAARAAGGSGIGLSIVRDIMIRHGGSAAIETGGGGGARFVLEFPGAARRSVATGTRPEPVEAARSPGVGRVDG